MQTANTGDARETALKSMRIVQGYLSSNLERTARMRITGDKGFLTVKGIGNASGAHTYEVDGFCGEGDVRYYNAMLNKRPFTKWGAGS